MDTKFKLGQTVVSCCFTPRYIGKVLKIAIRQDTRHPSSRMDFYYLVSRPEWWRKAEWVEEYQLGELL